MPDPQLVESDGPAYDEDEAECWWVDFCREGCPERECVAAGCCAYPPRDVVAVPVGDLL